METLLDVRERPDVSCGERKTHELIKRILKLRWIGMDAEAEQIYEELRQVDLKCTLLGCPPDTD